jgi:hypothetical protein
MQVSAKSAQPDRQRSATAWPSSRPYCWWRYPQLRAEDLANAWAYVRSHRDEIDEEIQQNEAA